MHVAVECISDETEKENMVIIGVKLSRNRGVAIKVCRYGERINIIDQGTTALPRVRDEAVLIS